MKDAERRKKEASKVKQTTKQSNTAHPRQSLFQRKISCLMYKYTVRLDSVTHKTRLVHKTVVFLPLPLPSER